MQEGDEVINWDAEQAAKEEEVRTIPSKVKVTIRFGYDKTMKEYCIKNKITVEEWIEGTFTHTQAHFRHKSLGTVMEFEV